MSISEGLIEAARMVAENEEEFSCAAASVGYNFDARDFYEELFMPKNYWGAWGCAWCGDDIEKYCHNKHFLIVQNCRVIALCLAAAIAESEGL